MEKMIESQVDLSGRNHYSDEIAELEKRCLQQKQELHPASRLGKPVQIARHPKRPVLQDYISLIFSDFIQLHGDLHWRRPGAHRRVPHHRQTPCDAHWPQQGQERRQTLRNFGPGKARGISQGAPSHGLPRSSICRFFALSTRRRVSCVDAEERPARSHCHQPHRKAFLEVPIMAVITGEGGSGGALPSAWVIRCSCCRMRCIR